MPILLVLIGIIIVVALFFIGIYNRLVNLRNGVKNAFSQIDVQLTRRYDLIPNLVEAVKGYMKHERETLDAVISARNAAVTGLKAAGANPSDPEAIRQLASAEATLQGSLGKMFALAEAYPDLKANQNFLALQEELATTENKIGFARQYYNDTAKSYKNRIEVFPSNVIAGMFNFQAEPFFQLESAQERVAPQVKF
jgi:LemA protein